MTRHEAEGLLGTRVEVWTAAKGVYVGLLEEVLPRRPWRGRVRITGTLAPAQAFEIGRVRPRRGHRPGEVIEAGGVNIRPTDQEGVDYPTALRLDLERLRALRASAQGSRHVWAIEQAIKAREQELEQSGADHE